MGYFDAQFVTDQGAALLARSTAGEGSIIFTSMRTGDGEYSLDEISRITSCDELKNEKGTFPINDVDSRKENTRVRAVISNKGLEEGYYIKEIGLYAKMDSENEVLFSVSVCREHPTFLPKMQDVPIELPVTNYVSYSGDGDFTLDYRSDVYATLDTVERLSEEVKKKINDLDDKKVEETELHSWARQPDKPSYSKIEVGLGNVDNTADKDKPVSTAMQAALDLFYANANQFTLNKIAELVNGAPTTMDTLKEIADVIAANKSVVDALDTAIGSKASQAELDTHTNNNTIHLTASDRQQLGTLVSQFGNKANSEAPLKCNTLPSNLTSKMTISNFSYNSNMGYYNLYSGLSISGINHDYIIGGSQNGDGYIIGKSGYYHLYMRLYLKACSHPSSVKRTGIIIGSNDWKIMDMHRVSTYEMMGDSTLTYLTAGTVIKPKFQMDSYGSTVTTATLEAVVEVTPIFVN